ncbi:MAG: hypothetical protein ACREFJ_14945 [Acetobacteraceae bacterium]
MPRQPSLLNRAQKKTEIEVKACAQGDHTYVLCRSEQRIAKDRAIRSKQEGHLRADIDRLIRRVADGKLVQAARINQAIGRLQERYPRVARYFRIVHDPETATIVCEFDAVKHARAEQLGSPGPVFPVSWRGPRVSSLSGLLAASPHPVPDRPADAGI